MCFLHVRFCSVLVRETELWFTCSVQFGQNGKTVLRSVTTRRPGTQNWERVVFLPSKNLYRKCDWSYRLEHQSCHLWIQFFVLLANFVGWLVAHWINVSFKGSIHSMSITQIVVYSFTLWSTLDMRNNFKLLIQKLWTIVLWRRSYLFTRRLVGSTYQTCSNGFYFRIARKSSKFPSFLWNFSLSFLQDLRSTNMK